MAEEKFFQSRKITERWFISGKLKLLTPAHFGGNQTTSLLDMPILLDSVDDSALLPGTSIAGALRNYLCDRMYGYAHAEPSGSPGEALFGYQRGELGEQSWLIVDDAFSPLPYTSIRDGIEQNPKTGTVAEKKKYDFEILAPGSEFQLNFELLIPENMRDELLTALCVALQGLERGEIRLGGRKSRGLGECMVTDWDVTRYDLTSITELEKYLRREDGNKKSDNVITNLFHEFLGEDFLPEKIDQIDARKRFEISTEFTIRDSLLIRSGGENANDPDFVQLTWQNSNGHPQPIISGSSLAGALKQRSRRILNKLSGNIQLCDQMYGYSPKKQGELPTASLLRVSESPVNNQAKYLVQSRIKIDRFTQSVITGALFNMQPIFSRKENQTRVKLTLCLLETPGSKYFEAQVGLLLQLLKDLWLEDLPIGGEISVGRGRLKGISANISYKNDSWTINENNDGSLSITPETGVDKLNDFAKKLIDYSKKEVANG